MSVRDPLDVSWLDTSLSGKQRQITCCEFTYNLRVKLLRLSAAEVDIEAKIGHEGSIHMVSARTDFSERPVPPSLVALSKSTPNRLRSRDCDHDTARSLTLIISSSAIS